MLYQVCWNYNNGERHACGTKYFACDNELAKFLIELHSRKCYVEHLETIWINDAESAIRSLKYKGVPELVKSAPRATKRATTRKTTSKRKAA